MNKSKILKISLVLVIIITSTLIYFLSKPVDVKLEQVLDQENSNPQRNDNFFNNKEDLGIYLGVANEDESFLINTSNGERKELAPSGYKIVNQHEYQQFPDFLILEKDKNIYIYNWKDKTIKNILINGVNLVLKEDESIYLYPSITEKNKFIFTINKLDLSRHNDLYGEYMILSEKNYLLDAKDGSVVGINFKKSDGCNLYDSKNNRIFEWACGEGVGSAAPLSIYDLNLSLRKEIIPAPVNGFTRIDSNNGKFFALNESVIVIDSNYPNLNKKELSLTANGYPYSVAIDQSNNTLIIGSSDEVSLIKYGQNNDYVDNKIFGDNDLYANFIFVDNGRLYYKTQNRIKTINLKSWQMESSIVFEDDLYEVTLFKI